MHILKIEGGYPIRLGETMSLETEKETYRQRVNELEQHEGKFVLIQGETVVDVFDTYSDAIRQGYREFGVDEDFLVKRIERPETAQSITRFIDPTVQVGA